MTKVLPFLTLALTMSTAVLHADSGSNGFRTATILVGFNIEASETNKLLLYNSALANELKRIGQGVHVLQVPAGLEEPILGFLKKSSLVRYAELDYRHKATGATVPNDPAFGNQWGLLNVGQLLNGYSGIPGQDIGATQAWGIATGSNSVVVALLDSGTQYTHPDLFANMWNNPGGIGGCAAGTHGYNVLAGNCDPMDDETWFGGHGTHVAGIAGAAGNSGAGVSGVNWTTNMMSVKWISSNATGFTSDLISAMDWVVRAKQAGVNIGVVNDSATWAGDAYSQALSDEIDLLGANGMLFVGASGNSGVNVETTPTYPCSYNRPNQICVAAAEMDGSLWVAANYGVNKVQLCAPGANIYSTLRVSNYGIVSGGSMAAAMVSGAAALVLSANPQSMSSLRSTILAAVDLKPTMVGKTVTGGMLNVCKALPGCGVAPVAAPAPIGSPVVSGLPQFGSVVSASTGRWSGSPVSFLYQWLRCDSIGQNCAPIAGATTRTYGIFAAVDIGATLSVAVTASNSFGNAAASASASAMVVNIGPVFAIGSTIADGSNLGGSVRWQATPSQTVNYVEFYVDGALSQSYTAAPYLYNASTTGLFDSTSLPAGTHALGIRGLASDNRTLSFYAATVTLSNAPFNTALPAISGSPATGKTLLVSNGNWNNSPTSFSYQWQQCDIGGNNCVAIAGATLSNYTVGAADGNRALRCKVTASNASGLTAAVSNTVAITLPGVINSPLPSGAIGSIYSAQFTATGGVAPYSWSITVGSLPAGLSLNGSTGAITGIPAAAGIANFTVQVTDSASQAGSALFSIRIGAPGTNIALLQSNSVEGTAVGSISASFNTSTGSGNLILAFVRMSTTSQTVSVTDSAGNNYVDAVSQVQNSDGHQIHLFYARNIKGGLNSVNATFSSTNNHPFLAIYEYSGLHKLNPLDRTTSAQGDGSTTAATPATAVTVSANEVVFSGAGLPNAWSGTASAGAGYTIQQQDTGSSRAATEVQTVIIAGSYSGMFALSTTASWSAVVATFAVQTPPGAPAITTAALPNGTIGSTYSATLGLTGGTSPFTWSIASGSLPAGLTLDSASGTIAGVPLSTGSNSFTVQVADAGGLTAGAPLSITINGLASIAKVQSKSTQGSSVSSLGTSFASANTIGNLIVVYLRMSSSNQTVTVRDTLGNTYTRAAAQVQNSDGHQSYIFYTRNGVTGNNTVTAAFSGVNGHPWIALYEFSGVSTLDKTASAQGNGAAPLTSAVNTTAASELIFSGAGLPNVWGGSITAGAGLSLDQQNTATSRAVTEYRIVNSGGTYSGGFTLSTSADWSTVLAAFK